jgi:hypothetical protein
MLYYILRHNDGISKEMARPIAINMPSYIRFGAILQKSYVTKMPMSSFF